MLFTLVIPGSVAVYAPLWLARDLQPRGGLPLVAAVALFVLGATIYAWTVWDFATFGRGTPAPIDAPKRLVVRGLFRYSRNPMYVGVLGVILGQAALFREPRLVGYALAVWTCFHLFVVLYEERALARDFGDEYAAYRLRVGRWLPRRLPRLG